MQNDMIGSFLQTIMGQKLTGPTVGVLTCALHNDHGSSLKCLENGIEALTDGLSHRTECIHELLSAQCENGVRRLIGMERQMQSDKAFLIEVTAVVLTTDA